MFKTLDLKLDGGVATVALNRPEARNAVDLAMCEELAAAAAKIAADPGVRVVLVRGAGPVFCAGADLKERAGKTKEWIRSRRLNRRAGEARGNPLGDRQGDWRGVRRRHAPRQALHRPGRGARPAGRARGRDRGDRRAARLGELDGQAMTWQPKTLYQVFEKM